MQTKKINIAIDGYSSCGKSTLAKALATELNYNYIDSGAMYRAITLYFLQHKIALDNTNAILDALQHIHIQISFQNNKTVVLLNNQDVSDEIRLLPVANKVSEVATIKEVRIFAVQQQQDYGKNGGIIMDGRDVGTVIFPNSELKIFMTASEEVRIQRRYSELKQQQPNISLDEVKQNIQHRDFIDTTRAIDPLVQAIDAKVLDNTFLTKEEQLSIVKQWFEEITANVDKKQQ